MPTPLLSVRNLVTQFATDDGRVKAVDGISFDIAPSSAIGIVGESGSGKSVTALSVMRLVSKPGRIVSGQILFDGKDLTQYLRIADARAARQRHRHDLPRADD